MRQDVWSDHANTLTICAQRIHCIHMKNYKNIRISAENYQELLEYKAECEKENGRSLSFDDAIELLFTEIAGLEYELGSERLKYKIAFSNKK